MRVYDLDEVTIDKLEPYDKGKDPHSPRHYAVKQAFPHSTRVSLVPKD